MVEKIMVVAGSDEWVGGIAGVRGGRAGVEAQPPRSRWVTVWAFFEERNETDGQNPDIRDTREAAP
jgi:hypothetical protein